MEYAPIKRALSIGLTTGLLALTTGCKTPICKNFVETYFLPTNPARQVEIGDRDKRIRSYESKRMIGTSQQGEAKSISIALPPF